MADRRITEVDFINSLNSNESFFVNQNNTIKQINKSDIVFNIANGGTGATTVEDARANLGVPEPAFIITDDVVPTLAEVREAYEAGRPVIYYYGTTGIVMNLVRATIINASFVGITTGGTLYYRILTSTGWAGAGNTIQIASEPIAEHNTGEIDITLTDNYEYSYTEVTSLAMVGASRVTAHGFITFSSSTPTITVSGFTASDGDDIVEALPEETWEFSVWGHNDKSFIIWKNWGVLA